MKRTDSQSTRIGLSDRACAHFLSLVRANAALNSVDDFWSSLAAQAAIDNVRKLQTTTSTWVQV